MKIHRIQDMSTTAITEAITTLKEAERRFNLHRTEDEQFFPEWRISLPDLTDAERTALNELRQRYLYQRAESHLLEGTVMLLLASPLLAITVFYDPPFRELEQLETELTISGATNEEIILAKANYFAQQDLWSDALQQLSSLEDLSNVAKDNNQKIVSYICQSDNL